MDAENAARQHKFVRPAADGESAAQAELERVTRSETLLLQVGWAAKASDDAMALAGIDLVLKRIDHIEKLAAAALRSYVGYVSA